MVHGKNFSLLSAFLSEFLLSGEPNEHDPEGFKPEASRIVELCVNNNFPDPDSTSWFNTPSVPTQGLPGSTRKRWIRSQSTAFYYMLPQNSRKLPDIKRGLEISLCKTQNWDFHLGFSQQRLSSSASPLLTENT